MATKTVTLNGTEQRVDELGGLNALIINNTTDVLYASAKAGIVPYADGVIEIQSGEAQTLPDSNGTVFLLGNGGRAQLTGIVNFRQPSRRSGGGGITRAEVNGIVTEKIAEVVANAPEDFDTLKEIADWIDGHEDSAAAMNSEIKANAADILDIRTEQETQNSSIFSLQEEMEQKADISEISNPNLLDNPDFKINQRGQSEYSGANTYTIDRWRTINNTAVKIFDDYIEIEQLGTGQPTICQFVENISDLSEETVTFSAKVRGDGINVPKLQFLNPDGEDTYAVGTASTDWQIISLTTVISKTAAPTTHFPRVYASINNDNKPKIGVKWVKLEFGDHSTPFVPPNTAIELLKCQRFYRTLGKGISASNGNNDSAVIYVPFLFPMRSTPSLTILEKPTFRYCDAWVGSDSNVEATIRRVDISETGIGFAEIFGGYEFGSLPVNSSINTTTDNFLALSADL